MIVVIGSPILAGGGLRPARPPTPAGAAGTAAQAAVAAAGAGSAVQLVGKVGNDEAGDQVLLALTRAGVGHAAVLRDAAHPTPVMPALSDEALDEPDVAPPGLALEAADVELALRYLTDFRVVVLADTLEADARASALAAAAFAGAHIVDLHADEAERRSAEPDPAFTAFSGEGADPAAFGRMAGRYAAGLDAGQAPAEAFRSATAHEGWAPSDS